MMFDDIEFVLGKQVVADVRQAVQAAYIASRSTSNTDGRLALEDLLIALLIATTVTPSENALGAQRIVDCCRRLEDLGKATRIQYGAVKGKPDLGSD